MHLHFSIEYQTNWGQELELIAKFYCSHGKTETKLFPLSTRDGLTWELDLEIPKQKWQSITYHYRLCQDKQRLRREWEKLPHRLQLEKIPASNCLIQDVWQDRPSHSYLYSSAFKSVWLARKEPFIACNISSTTLCIQVLAPQLRANEVLAICGNHESLGNWEPTNALILSDIKFPLWQQSLSKDLVGADIAYKFVILNQNSKELIAWEVGNDRILLLPELPKNTSSITNVYPPIFERKQWKGAGVACPVFSLRTKKSWGIGEFLDIKTLVDWGVETQQKIIQILPVNDTTQSFSWADSYPYRCISVFALNPIYINLEQLGILNTKYKADYLSLQAELNKEQLDFPKVQQLKLVYLKELYDKFGKQTLANDSYQKFLQTQEAWLIPYSIYCYLREKYQTTDTNKWGKYATYSPQIRQELESDDSNLSHKLQFYMYVQYHLHTQLESASTYAKSKGVVLKGDLPIGIGLHSVDAWMFPTLFKLDSQAGAPPDDFATQGQNWGFPTYNWTEMAKDDYSWWKKRLKHLSMFFDAYRIDHILGFFRIWSIPRAYTQGIMGLFDPALPLSISEIEKAGIHFEKNLYTQPYIDLEILQGLFGNKAKEIKTLFFKAELNSNKTLIFKSKYNTQYKLQNFFLTERAALLSEEDKAKLLNLYTHVLFIEDSKLAQHYHPRIDAHKTTTYKRLSPVQQQAYMQLYNHFFYERHNVFWKEQAYRKLPSLISATDMLVCGEDLGMIPQSVPEVMDELSILSLEISRMPKESNMPIGNPATYPYLSVASFSTHDMPSLRGWWKQDSENKKQLQANLQVATNEQELSPTITKANLERELEANSMLSIQAIQDWIALSEHWANKLSSEDEQINVPANPNNQWKYRLPCYLEDLIADDELNKIIRILVNHSNRN